MPKKLHRCIQKVFKKRIPKYCETTLKIVKKAPKSTPRRPPGPLGALLGPTWDTRCILRASRVSFFAVLAICRFRRSGFPRLFSCFRRRFVAQILIGSRTSYTVVQLFIGNIPFISKYCRRDRFAKTMGFFFRTPSVWRETNKSRSPE